MTILTARPGKAAVRYQILWKRSAEDQLADIWLAAEDRELITRTAAAIDEHLEKSGPAAGESRPDGKRILIMAPLGIKFQVYPNDAIIRVADVWRFRTVRE